jgi:hypothetical protein
MSSYAKKIDPLLLNCAYIISIFIKTILLTETIKKAFLFSLYWDRETPCLRRIQFSLILSQCCVLEAGLAGFRAAYQGFFEMINHFCL